MLYCLNLPLFYTCSILGNCILDNIRIIYLLGSKKRGTRRQTMKAYCFKCRKMKEMRNPEKVTLKNGLPATKGICPSCGTKMSKIG